MFYCYCNVCTRLVNRKFYLEVRMILQMYDGKHLQIPIIETINQLKTNTLNQPISIMHIK